MNASYFQLTEPAPVSTGASFIKVQGQLLYNRVSPPKSPGLANNSIAPLFITNARSILPQQTHLKPLSF